MQLLHREANASINHPNEPTQAPPPTRRGITHAHAWPEAYALELRRPTLHEMRPPSRLAKLTAISRCRVTHLARAPGVAHGAVEEKSVPARVLALVSSDASANVLYASRVVARRRRHSGGPPPRGGRLSAQLELRRVRAEEVAQRPRISATKRKTPSSAAKQREELLRRSSSPARGARARGYTSAAKASRISTTRATRASMRPPSAPRRTRGRLRRREAGGRRRPPPPPPRPPRGQPRRRTCSSTRRSSRDAQAVKVARAARRAGRAAAAGTAMSSSSRATCSSIRRHLVSRGDSAAR